MTRPAALLAGILFAACAHAAGPPDTVRCGHPALRGLRLPWASDTVDSYRVADGVRTPTSTTIRDVTRGVVAGESVFVMRTRHWAPGNDTATTLVTVRAADLSLVQHSVRAALDSAAVTATRSHLSGWVVLPNQLAKLLDLPLAHPVLPVEGQIPWLWPLLPLGPGYRAAIPHFSPWSGREEWTNLVVEAVERVRVGGRDVDCWRADSGPLGPPGYRMIRWIERDSRRVARSVLRGAAGQPEFVAERRP